MSSSSGTNDSTECPVLNLSFELPQKTSSGSQSTKDMDRIRSNTSNSTSNNSNAYSRRSVSEATHSDVSERISSNQGMSINYSERSRNESVGSKPVSAGGNRKLSKSNNNTRRASATSLNTTFNTSYMKPSTTVGNRTSIVSNYSGIVHNLDIDTIKYVGNKASLQLSDLTNSVGEDEGEGVSSDDDILVMHSRAGSFKSQSSLNELQTKPSTKGMSKKMSLDNESLVKLIKNKVEHSPIRNSMTPPKSPLPQLNNVSPSHSVHSSPLKNRRRSSSVASTRSTTSSQIHGQLDDIMKEVHDMSIGLTEDDDDKMESFEAKQSITNSTNTDINSFHTAHSENLNNESVELFEHFEAPPWKERDGTGESSEEYTKSLNVVTSILDPNRIKEDQETLRATPPHPFANSSNSSGTKKTPSPNNRHSRSSNESRGSGGGSGQRSTKRRSREFKHKVKPFSYETLAKLLNATDGIIIGQEFATLDIPTQEKFLIERIVDSISRLTANMMLNPSRYDQSCARLERVLNVLEGFD